MAVERVSPDSEAYERGAAGRIRGSLPYEELAALVVKLRLQLQRAQARIVELEARLGRDSTNFSQPPSADSIATKAKRRADRSPRERSAQRKPGGQPGQKTSELAPATAPDRTQTRPAPSDCSGCWRIWARPRMRAWAGRRCGTSRRCVFRGCTTCCRGGAAAAAGRSSAASRCVRRRGGTVVYGPNVNTAAILLAWQGNVPLERTAQLMAALLGAPVSIGFVVRALARFSQCLQRGAGFDEAMMTALRAEDVLCGDEMPVNLLRTDTDEHGTPVAGSPHAVTVRTPDARLVYYAPIGSRSKTALAGLGVLEGYTGYLIRDDYASWHQFNTQLAGVQQCTAHLIRHAKAILELHPIHQNWASEVIDVLREAAAAVTTTQTQRRDHLDPQLLTDLRRRYDHAVAWGHHHQPLPRLAPRPPTGYNLAKRLHDKAEQVWLFIRNLAVPWINNASEVRHEVARSEWTRRWEGQQMMLTT